VRRLDTVLGVQAKVTLVEPRTIAPAAAGGKIKRVVDKRRI
jgi:phenylacetate-coenzyme A ligase PaaK-like adenylate-forming protein